MYIKKKKLFLSILNKIYAIVIDSIYIYYRYNKKMEEKYDFLLPKIEN